MLAHRVHLGDVGATFQQGAVDLLFVGQAQTVSGQGQQRRTAARDEANHQVVGLQALHQRQDALGGLHACGVGHRVGGFQHLDALRQTGRAGRRVVVAGDDHARHRRIGRPQLLERLRHGTGGFARPNHHGATARHGGQHGRQVQERLGPRHGCGKELA